MRCMGGSHKQEGWEAAQGLEQVAAAVSVQEWQNRAGGAPAARLTSTACQPWPSSQNASDALAAARFVAHTHANSRSPMQFWSAIGTSGRPAAPSLEHVERSVRHARQLPPGGAGTAAASSSGRPPSPFRHAPSLHLTQIKLSITGQARLDALGAGKTHRQNSVTVDTQPTRNAFKPDVDSGGPGNEETTPAQSLQASRRSCARCAWSGAAPCRTWASLQSKSQNYFTLPEPLNRQIPCAYKKKGRSAAERRASGRPTNGPEAIAVKGTINNGQG